KAPAVRATAKAPTATPPARKGFLIRVPAFHASNRSAGPSGRPDGFDGGHPASTLLSARDDDAREAPAEHPPGGNSLLTTPHTPVHSCPARTAGPPYQLGDRQLAQRPTLEHDGLPADGTRGLELDGIHVLPRQPSTGGVVGQGHDADVVQASALVQAYPPR